MAFDLIIRGGTVVSGAGSRRLDVCVRDGRIAALRPPAAAPERAGRVLDARGLLVLPGIIDAHSHFHLRLGPGKYTADGFESGSAAAACGGVTTFLDYTGQGPGESPLKGLKDRVKEASGRCYADFAFHCMLTGWGKMKDPAGQMAACVKAGAPTFKMFTAYGARGLMAPDAALQQALRAAAGLGGLICVHAENGPLIDYLADLFAPAGILALPLSRPPFTETEAVGRVAGIAAAARAPVYFVHQSAAGSAAVIAAARKAGLRVMGETCPQYLTLDESLFKKKDGHLYSCCPPIRSRQDSEALWKALASGALQVLATDSCTFTRAQKDAWKGDVRRLPMGMPGSQTLLASAYTFGVKSGKLSLARLAQALCENPARIMGLASKGFIKPGFDADFALLDPAAPAVKTDWRNLKHNTQYSPWQGRKLFGFPKYTILRGEVIAEAGELAAPKNFRGRFIRRTKPTII